MGGWLCCLPRQDEFDSSEDRCRAHCFRSCCGMYEALVQPSEEEHENQITPTHTLSLSAGSGLIEGTTSGSSNESIDCKCINRQQCPIEKDAPSVVLYTLENSKSTMGGREVGGLAIGHTKGTANFSGDEKKATVENDFCRVQLLNGNGKVESLASLVDDDDICPICLEGYDCENPKLTTKCGHCFHLACILEWMERSSHCAICYKETEFDERL